MDLATARDIIDRCFCAVSYYSIGSPIELVLRYAQLKRHQDFQAINYEDFDHFRCLVHYVLSTVPYMPYIAAHAIIVNPNDYSFSPYRDCLRRAMADEMEAISTVLLTYERWDY
jgi:hypothetical protein